MLIFMHVKLLLMFFQKKKINLTFNNLEISNNFLTL